MHKDIYDTADEARSASIAWSYEISCEASPSYGELMEWQQHWERVAADFPELADEFAENGII